MAVILLFEDDERHAGEACQVLEVRGHQVIVRNTGEALWDLEELGIDAVVTDLFFPLEDPEEGENGSDYSDPDQPTGLLVAAFCRNKGYPCAICTDGTHHGNKLELYHRLAVQFNLALLCADNSSFYEPGADYRTARATHKDWNWAADVLEKELSAKSQ